MYTLGEYSSSLQQAAAAYKIVAFLPINPLWCTNLFDNSMPTFYVRQCGTLEYA